MTAAAPARTGLRWGQVYGIDVIDHDSWMAGAPVIVVNDYVGQSRQKRRARENQHRDDKPWSDLIVGSPRVLWEGGCTDAELDEMERRFIQDVPLEQRPRLNYLLNEDNPHRIEKYRQVNQRHARDGRRDEDPWQPTEYRPEAYGYRPASQAHSAAPARREWKPWQKALAGYGGAYLTLILGGWVALEHWYDFDAWWQPPAICALIPPAALLAAVVVLATTRGKKPRRSKRSRR
ncbi:hypothetical protein [Actinoplanes sp. URMC 104]|uniref:hypothetical protein n=1 Tax=Actinoplanes sp. URMC 104 TaxID=3423409 RepID=UPI003F1A79BA